MGKMLGLKKVDSYWLVHKEFFDTILVNGKTRVVIDSFEYWYAGQVKYRKVNGAWCRSLTPQEISAGCLESVSSIRMRS